MDQNQIPANNTLQALPEGIIELKQTGYQTKESIAQYRSQIYEFILQKHKDGRRALILVDLTGVTGQEPEVLAKAREQLDGDYDAMALLGTSSTIQMILNWMLRTFGKSEKIRMFGERDKAIAWLLSKN